jgi:hypothetical protein
MSVVEHIQEYSSYCFGCDILYCFKNYPFAQTVSDYYKVRTTLANWEAYDEVD